MKKIKNGLVYIICASLGALTFALLAIPYLTAFASLDLGDFGNGSNKSYYNGYKMLNLWEGGFGGVMSSLFQIFVILAAVILLVYGALGLLKVFKIIDILPDKIGKLESTKLGEFCLIGYASLNLLLLIFMIVFCASNTESEGIFGASIAAGFKLNAGIFITLIIAIGAFILNKFLSKKTK